MSKATLLFVIKGSALNRGMNTGIENLAWSLAALGYNVHILSGGEEPSEHSFSVAENVSYFFTGKPPSAASLAEAYGMLAHEYSYDVVIGWVRFLGPISLSHKTGNGPLFIANQGSITRGAHRGLMSPGSMIATFTKALTGRMRLRGALSAIIDRSHLYSGIDYVVSISRAVQENVVAAYGIDRQKCLVIHRGIDTDFFDHQSRDFGLAAYTNTISLLYTGNVIRAKGVADIVDAAIMLQRPVNLVCCGNYDREFAECLRKKFESSRTQGAIAFTGALTREKLRVYYQQCAYFVFPSYSEGLGKSLLEAMACRMPVIVSDIASLKEIVRPGFNGLMVSVQAPDRLAQAISQYIDDPELRRICGENARETVLSSFDKKAEVSAWSGLIERELGKGRRRRSGPVIKEL